MKAAVIYENGPPEVLRYEDVPEPECPDGCVVVDAEAISIEGGDLLARAAAPPPSCRTSSATSSAGTVSEVGAGVEGRRSATGSWRSNAVGSHAARRAVPAIDDLADPRRARRGHAPPACRSRSAPRTSACSPPATWRRARPS